MDYELIGYREGDLVKRRSWSTASRSTRFDDRASRAAENAAATWREVKEIIHRHLFEIPIQAAIGGKIIARETIWALRKNVTAKCYGGDVTRKRKLLEKQKEGKKRMRSSATSTFRRRLHRSAEDGGLRLVELSASMP